jgi:chromosome segregation protein
MRFARFDLTCFGHFRDQRLEFPLAGQDFHLIVGRNEAGKSTLRAALGDFLFGIGHQTPWAFRYDGAELALAARLHIADGSLDLVRRKRRKAALQHADGREAAEGVLAAALGGATREFFERMSSLDHAGLRAGGQRILESSDDTGRQLFEAAAGVGSFGPLREALRAESEEIWTPRRSRDRSWYQAHDAYEEARRALQAATVTVTRWRAANDACDAAQAELAAANESLGGLRRTLSRLQRIRRTAPQLVQLEALRGELAALGVLPSLPADATPKLAEARHRIAGAIEAQRMQEVLAARARDRLALLAPDAAVLASAADIRKLAATAARVADFPRDLASRRAELAGELESLGNLVADLGWPSADPAVVRQRIPPAPRRAELQALITEQAQRVTALAQWRDEQLRAERQLERVHAALDEVDAELGIAAGFPAGISPPPPPPIEPADLVLVESAMREAADALRDAQAECRRLEQAHGEAARIARASAGDGSLVRREDLLAARLERDALWQRIAAGAVPLADSAAEFGHRIDGADALADRRIERAQDAAGLEAAQRALAQVEDELLRAQATEARARGGVATLQERWLARLGPRAPGLTVAQYQAWSARREEKARRCVEMREMLGQRRDDVAAAEAALRRWQDEWQQSVGRVQLGADTVTGAQSVLARLGDLGTLLDRIHQLEQRRIMPMAEQLAAFATEAAALLARARPGSAGQMESATVIASSLEASLHEADQQQRQRLEAGRELDEALGAIALAKIEQAAIGEALASLFAAAGVETLPMLEERVSVWQRGEELRQQIRAVEDQLRAAGDGLGLDALAAEAAGQEIDAVRGELEALESRMGEETTRVQQLAVQAQQAADALAAIGGEGAAAAEFDRQGAVARLSAATERYLQVRIAGKMLDWSLGKFRDERQGPLLERAAARFARLTLGAFDGLVVDEEGGKPQLRGRRPDRSYVDSREMSEGTCDQLYLALRLAAIDLHLEGRPALPFIADDLFITFDRERTAAGLRELQALSTKTQVLFLTHHDFIIDEARAVFGESLNLLRLPERAAVPHRSAGAPNHAE